jgi:hypothetical protein
MTFHQFDCQMLDHPGDVNEGHVPKVVEKERFSSEACHGGTLPRSWFVYEENRNEESLSSATGSRQPQGALRAQAGSASGCRDRRG